MKSCQLTLREADHVDLNVFICCVYVQSRYKESWTKIRDGGYKLQLDAIPFQSAKASAEILSNVRLHSLIRYFHQDLSKVSL